MYYVLVILLFFTHYLFKVAMQTRKYLSRLCFISGLFFLASCTNEAKIPSKMVSFEDAFQLQRKIYLDEEIKLAGIHSFNVDKLENILLLDIVTKQVILITKEGKLTKNISPDTCHPGHDWSPFAANFNKNGNILVLTKVGQIYWFSKTGECTTKVSTVLKRPPNMKIAFDESGNFYFIEANPIETYLFKSDSLGTKTSRFKVNNPRPSWNGFSVSNTVVGDGKNLWVGLSYFDGFYSYDQQGNNGNYTVLLNLFKTKFGIVTLNFHRYNTLLNSNKIIGINIYDQNNNNLRYVLTDDSGWFLGKDQNDFFYTTFNPSKEDLAACKQCGAKTTWGLNVYQLKNQ